MTEGLVARGLRIIDRSQLPRTIESLIGRGGRPRQLPVRTMLLGIWLTTRQQHGATLVGAHRALLALPREQQIELGVLKVTNGTEHLLTYRQFEYLFSQVSRLVDPEPVLRRRMGETIANWVTRMAAQAPSEAEADMRRDLLARLTDLLLDASIPHQYDGHTAHAVDGTDIEGFCKPVPKDAVATDPNTAWGRRSSKQPGVQHAMYRGYQGSVVCLTPLEGGPPVPEFVRSIRLHKANENAARNSIQQLRDLAALGMNGDLLADSHYPMKKEWSLAMGQLGFDLIVDLHPEDRGQKGTEQGAIIAEGALWCPATPKQLLAIDRLSPGATEGQRAEHFAQMRERDRYRFQSKGSADEDGYQRFECPAEADKARCPLVVKSLVLPPDLDHHRASR